MRRSDVTKRKCTDLEDGDKRTQRTSRESTQMLHLSTAPVFLRLYSVTVMMHKSVYMRIMTAACSIVQRVLHSIFAIFVVKALDLSSSERIH